MFESNHANIIKEVNGLFKENWTETKVHFDSSLEVKHKDEYISLSLTPLITEKKYLGSNAKAYQTKQSLRVYIYGKNPTKSFEILDKVLNFLKDKKIGNLRFYQEEGLGQPFRNTNGELYTSFVDFEVCYLP